MSNLYDRPEDAPATRERETVGDGSVGTAHSPGGVTQQQGYVPPAHAQPAYDYGYGRRPMAPWRSMHMRRQFPIETKPFFLTSEWLVLLLSLLAIGMTTALTDVQAELGIILATAACVFYVLSRGIAKSGTQSLAPDPREHVDLTRIGRDND
jgi:hypothetical protein